MPKTNSQEWLCPPSLSFAQQTSLNRVDEQLDSSGDNQLPLDFDLVAQPLLAVRVSLLVPQLKQKQHFYGLISILPDVNCCHWHGRLPPQSTSLAARGENYLSDLAALWLSPH